MNIYRLNLRQFRGAFYYSYAQARTFDIELLQIFDLCIILKLYHICQ